MSTKKTLAMSVVLPTRLNDAVDIATSAWELAPDDAPVPMFYADELVGHVVPEALQDGVLYGVLTFDERVHELLAASVVRLLSGTSDAPTDVGFAVLATAMSSGGGRPFARWVSKAQITRLFLKGDDAFDAPKQGFAIAMPFEVMRCSA